MEIIEIQFYLQQIIDELSINNRWDEKWRAEFVRGAKQCLKNKEDLFAFSENFISIKNTDSKTCIDAMFMTNKGNF